MPEELWNENLAAAFRYACELHKGQVRKQTAGTEGVGIPYVGHLMAVASLVLDHGGDEEEVIAALLHDGPEDQGGQETLEVIRQRWGDRVARIVEDCSDTLEQVKPEWKERKRSYLDHLRSSSSDSLFLVSVADKLHNVRSILADYRLMGEQVWQRFTGKKEGTLWYYESLLQIYEERAPDRCRPLVDELSRTLGTLQGLVEQQERTRQEPESGHP